MVGIILASGLSKRFGKNKLLQLINGKPMIWYVLKASKESLIKNLIVVYKDSEVKEICENLNIHSVFNDKYNLGQSEGIKKGVETYLNEDAFMFIMGDQPFLTSKTIDKLIDEFYHKDKIIVPRYKDRRGSPVIFPKRYKNNLLKLNGDIGGKTIIKSNSFDVEFCYISNEKELMDIDDKKTLDALI